MLYMLIYNIYVCNCKFRLKFSQPIVGCLSLTFILSPGPNYSAMVLHVREKEAENQPKFKKLYLILTCNINTLSLSRVRWRPVVYLRNINLVEYHQYRIGLSMYSTL